MIRFLSVLALSGAIAGCGSDGETTQSTGVDTSTGTGSGNGGGGGIAAGNPGRLQFSASSVTVAENAGNATLTVTRTDGTDGAVSVTVATSDGSATQAQDYTALNTIVTFAAGDATAKTVNVPILNDTTAETGETLTVTLSAPTGNAALGSTSQVLITLTDDDVVAPAGPKAVLTGEYKHLRANWTAVPGATSYRVMKDATGSAGFTQVGADLATSATSASIDTVVSKEDWQNALYAIAACNSAGCTQSAALSAAGLSVPLIGYLKAPLQMQNAELGTALALSADGNTLAVGAPGAGDAATPYSGVVYVYTRTGINWSAPTLVKPTNAEDYDGFGASLALSADGSTLVVGAIYEDSNGASDQDNSVQNSGAGYIFTRSASAWTQAAYLKSDVAVNYEEFGATVAISPDGAAVVVGVPDRDVPATTNYNAGAVFVFTQSGSAWTRTGPLTAPSPQAYASFGQSLALSNQGALLVVGANGQNVGAVQYAGAVFTYTRSGGGWTPGPIITSDAPQTNSSFGTSLSLSHDGTKLAVGAVYEDVAGTNPGVGYIFDVSTGAATLVTKLTASNSSPYDYFGGQIALSGDGSTVIVSASGDDSSTIGAGTQADELLPESGAAYVFSTSGSTWTQRTYLKAANPESNDGFGSALAINGDGTILAIGAPYEDSGSIGLNGNQLDDCEQTDTNCAEESGAVYVY